MVLKCCCEVPKNRDEEWLGGWHQFCQTVVQEIRVPRPSAAARPTALPASSCSCKCFAIACFSFVFLPSSPHESRVGVPCSGGRYPIGTILLLPRQRFGVFSCVLVFRLGSRSPLAFLAVGHVTMAEEKSVPASIPPRTTIPGHGLERGAVSSLVERQGVKECAPVETSRLLPRLPFAPPSQEATAERERMAAVDCTTPACIDGEKTPEARADAVHESASCAAPSTALEPNVGLEGESAANNAVLPEGDHSKANESLAASDHVTHRIETSISQTAESLGNGKLERESKVHDEENKSGKEVHGDSIIAAATLLSVLEKLISLDPAENFREQVDDSFAPNYSKIIKAPMCFSTMKEKIRLHQYNSWLLFVEDFERICDNSMKYNQKRSRIWNAANTLLRQGKKVLELYWEHGESTLGVVDAAEDVSQSARGDTSMHLIQDALHDIDTEDKHESMDEDTAEVVVKVAAQTAVEHTPAELVENAAEKVAEDSTNITAQNPSGTVIQDAPRSATLEEVKSVTRVMENTVVAEKLDEGGSAGSHQGGALLRESVYKQSSHGEAEMGTTSTATKGVEKGDVPRADITRKDLVKQLGRVAPKTFSVQNHRSSRGTEGHATAISVQRRAHLVPEDVQVEILESIGSEDVRPDSGDDATECSSSFGNTHNQVDSDEDDIFLPSTEVESELRHGNGALSSAYAEDDELAGGNERGKKALNADWKKYRRGIEWRCHWLEVRLNELRTRAEKYERLLEDRKAKKAWLAVQTGEESSARTARMIDSPQRGRILRRLRRTEIESTVDLDLYMARHPLFSRYDRKKSVEAADACAEATSDIDELVQNQQSLDPERGDLQESDTEEQMIMGRSSVGGQDSMEQILWKVEALQARVGKAKVQLDRGIPSKSILQPLTIPRHPGNLSRGPPQASPRILAGGMVPRPPGTKGRPLSGHSAGFSGTSNSNGAPQRHGSSASLRRKSSDYDINNMVMTVNVGTKYVEHIKHADIWTPHWRLLDNMNTAEQPIDCSSSDEDTDDEAFERRHSVMEVSEKQQRCMLPSKRSPDGDPSVSGKGRPKSGMGKCTGKMASRGSVPTKVIAAMAIESPDSNSSPAFAGSVPKGKRRKRLFNAMAFTTNHAQRLAAYLAEPSGSLDSPEAAEESLFVEDILETRTSEEKSNDIILSEPENCSVQSIQSADEAGFKRKTSAASSGLQVLANP